MLLLSIGAGQVGRHWFGIVTYDYYRSFKTFCFLIRFSGDSGTLFNFQQSVFGIRTTSFQLLMSWFSLQFAYGTTVNIFVSLNISTLA